MRTLPNVLAMPHIGYVTDVSYQGFYGGAVECVQAFVAADPVNVLNPEVLTAPNLRAVDLRD